MRAQLPRTSLNPDHEGREIIPRGQNIANPDHEGREIIPRGQNIANPDHEGREIIPRGQNIANPDHEGREIIPRGQGGAKKGIEMYRSPESGISTPMRLPANSGRLATSNT